MGDRGDNNMDFGERSGSLGEATSDGEKSEDGEKIDEVKEYTGDAILDAGDARENLEKWRVSEEGEMVAGSKTGADNFLGSTLSTS